ncbi:LarC family nickel insertion protein [Paraburkholderia sp. JPY419]|uniref:LarC family nickel insertion protein n=1 Tax=Paraburkholderia sp. JPY419 TaxID=667660 RepID=UPI003D246E78
MRIHLDTLGGMAGDMFIAALLDAFPQCLDGLTTAIHTVLGPQAVVCRLEHFDDGVFRGKRFVVAQGHDRHTGHDHAHPHVAHAGHDHAHWKDIRQRLANALPSPIGRTATGIFQLLAEAEAYVHGTAPEDVTFHEVGNWDSIADVVGAAYLIDSIGADWTVSEIPLGGGRIETMHGLMPLPAPATARLLEGMLVVDDGIAGERVTPTGAAILRYLSPQVRVRSGAPQRIAGTGTGFGSRRLAGVSNCVRALILEDSAPAASSRPGVHRELAVIEFEVDDQTPEDLATGIVHLRAHPAIHDVVQMPVTGKKGRIATSVRILASPQQIEAALDACFRETTTIGLRYHFVQGAALERRMVEVDVDGHTMRVKRVERPGGATAKAEADDVVERQVQAERAAYRQRAAALALQSAPTSSHEDPR